MKMLLKRPPGVLGGFEKSVRSRVGGVKSGYRTKSLIV